MDFKYTALSYTWGDSLSTTPILMNSVETQVTINLETALRHIRQPTGIIILWIDAICINQEDLAKKNHQVEMMKEIFSGAELVIAWLGSAGEDSELAMGVFGRGLKALVNFQGPRYESTKESEPGQPDSWLISKKQGVNMSSGYHEDITTPSAQKAAMAGPQLSAPATLANFGDPCALSDLIDEQCDEQHITEHPSFSSIGRNFGTHDSASNEDDAFFHAMMDTRITSACQVMRKYRMAMKTLTTREIFAMRKLLKRSWWYRIWVVQEVLLAKKVTFKCGDAEVSGQRMSSWRALALLVLDTWRTAHTSTGHIFPAVTLLEKLRNPIEETTVMDYLFRYDMREATRPHDYLYGLLGIIPTDHRNLLGAPDYGCKPEDLFIRVATNLMVEYNSLKLLRAAGVSAPSITLSPTRMRLPSWVPDWTTQCFNRNPQDVFELTTPFPEPVFSFSEDSMRLTVTGWKFDAVESVQSVPALAQGKMPLWQSTLMTDESTRDDQMAPPLQGLKNALLVKFWPGEHAEFYWFAAFLQELEEYRVFVSKDEARGRHENSGHLAGFLHWTGETRDGRSDEEILQKVYSAETARSFSAWYHRQTSEDLQCCYMMYAIWRDGSVGNAGFWIFKTSKGSFGIMRAAVATGDVICVVPGCGAPLVLRKVDFSKYLLLGPVHGLPGLTSDVLTQAVKKNEIKRETFTLV